MDWGTGEVALHDFSGRNLIRDTSFEKDVSLHKDLKPVEDKCSFTIDFVQSIANTLLTLDYDQIVTVRINEVVDGSASAWFYGYVRPVTKYSIDLDDRVIEIEALDNSWRLKRKPTARATYTDQRLDTVVNAILTAAGYSSTERSMVPSLSDNVSRITWQAYDEEWEDTLTELLYAYGYLYYFDEAGRFRVYAWITDTLSVVRAFNDNNIIGRLEVDRDDERTGIKFTPGAPTEEIKITQYETRTIEDVILVSRESFSSFLTGALYPTSTTHNYGASIDEIQTNLGATNLEVVDTSNVYVRSRWRGAYISEAFRFEYTEQSFIHASTDSILTTFSVDDNNRESTIQFTGPSTLNGIPLNRIESVTYELIGDLEVRFDSGEYTIEVPQGLDDKIDNPYIDFGTDQASRIGTALTDRASTAIYSYQGRSDSFFAIGQYVQVQSTDLNIDTVGRVISRRHVYDSGLVFYEYEIEGAKAIGSLVGTVTPINGTQVITSAGTTSVTGTVNSGLNPDGSISRPIVGSNIQDTETIDGDVYQFSPGENGLLFNSTSLGFYDFDTDSWPVQLQNDAGVGKAYFGNGSDRYMEWNGTDLNITGAANIGGTITAGDGIQSADFVTGVSGWRIDGDGTAEFDEALVRGTIEATTGAIGGWDITANALEADDDSVVIRSDLRRLEVRDALDVPKVVSGYLSGIADYEATDFGLYVGPGASVGFSSGATFEEGNYLINSDAAFIAESGGVESVRLGSLGSGDIGLDIGGMLFESAVLGGGGATGDFEATVLGGGGATGTFESVVLGGGGARYGTKAGLLYSLADDKLFLTGTLVGVDGEFSGTVSAGTIIGGTIEGTDITGVNITGTTISGGTITGTTISGTTISGADITGGTIDIGSGNFTVDSAGDVLANNIDIAGGDISGLINLGSTGSLLSKGGDDSNFGFVEIDQDGFSSLGPRRPGARNRVYIRDGEINFSGSSVDYNVKLIHSGSGGGKLYADFYDGSVLTERVLIAEVTP
jgi:hypothetical protein